LTTTISNTSVESIAPIKHTGSECELLTMEQVCDALKIGRSTLYKLVYSNSIIAVKLRGRTLFRPDDIAKYIASLDAFERPLNAF